MGLFDYVRCKFPLPIEGAELLEFQTKDTPAQNLDWYEIRADRTLWHSRVDYDRVVGPPIQAVPEQCFMTGEIRFYTSLGADNWVEFSAYFVRGELKHMETISDGDAAQAKEPGA